MFEIKINFGRFIASNYWGTNTMYINKEHMSAKYALIVLGARVSSRTHALGVC